jgi:hypothetical protein
VGGVVCVWGVWGCGGVGSVWGVGGVGVGVCGRCGGVGSLLTFDIPQTALVATLDTYDFSFIQLPFKNLLWHIRIALAFGKTFLLF